LDYEYSPSCFTLYLGVKGLDLRDFGFGNWNLWHYAHDDVNECYKRQLDDEKMDDPSLFMSTPSLHGKIAGIAPDRCQQLVVCTPCTYQYFQRFKKVGRSDYLAEKERVTELILRQIESHYVPNLHKQLDIVVAGTPSTNKKFVLAPEGNAYGANLTPRQLNVGKIDYRTPFSNLWLVGATAGAPSFAGGVHFASMLYQRLTGQRIH
jgi:phytoene dehydrogenase-like protein